MYQFPNFRFGQQLLCGLYKAARRVNLKGGMDLGAATFKMLGAMIADSNIGEELIFDMLSKHIDEAGSQNWATLSATLLKHRGLNQTWQNAGPPTPCPVHV